MSNQANHVSVCVCTYKRPELLKRLLDALTTQDTGGLFTYSITIVDNDHKRSAEAVVSDSRRESGIPIGYLVEPQQNIALARNRAIKDASGDFIAFIDDDEFPIKGWLLTLFTALKEYGVDGVLGPVKPHFDVKPPAWFVRGGFYDRPSYPTGHRIEWRQGRTGNVLFKRSILTSDAQLFRAEFRAGEDQDFFRRLIEKGHQFIWCHEAMAYEVVPPIRWNRKFLLRRALLLGEVALHHPTFGARDVLKSLIAIPAYIIALPFALILDHGKFMLLLVKLFSHVGRFLGMIGMNPIREPYVTG